MDGTTFGQERMTDIWPEMEPLSQAHMDEVGICDTLLCPQLSVYHENEKAGRHRCYTVRVNGALVGYCSMILCLSHFDSQLEAHEDCIYIRPDQRGFLGGDFQRYCDTLLIAEKVVRIFRERIIHGSEAEDGRALRRGPLGYKPQSVLWVRKLTNQHPVEQEGDGNGK